MKSKRFLRIAALLLAVLSFAILPKTAFSVYADDEVTDNTDVTEEVTDPVEYETIDKICGYQYDLSYILKDAGVTETTNKTVNYRLAELADGTTVEENDGNYAESAFDAAGSTLEFKNKGTYKFEIYNSEDALEGTFEVNVVSWEDVDETSMSFSFNDQKLSAVSDAAKNQATGLNVGDSFSFSNSSLSSALEDISVSKYFPYANLTKTYYYASSQSTSYSSTTSSRFTVSTAGTYSFYVLLSDECQNKMTTDDLVEGPGGWYEQDEDGNRTGSVVIPIFTFTVDVITAPEITVATSEAGYLNLKYTVDCFTVTSDDYKAEYKLYYSEVQFDKDDDSYETDSAYIEAVLANSTTVDVTDELFSEDSMSFTPNKKGYYYVLIRAVDSANMSEVAMSRAISVQREYSTVKVESEFLKNNVVALIFFGISLVALIALIILLFIKPKENDVELEVNEHVEKTSKKK